VPETAADHTFQNFSLGSLLGTKKKKKKKDKIKPGRVKKTKQKKRGLSIMERIRERKKQRKSR